MRFTIYNQELRERINPELKKAIENILEMRKLNAVVGHHDQNTVHLYDLFENNLIDTMTLSQFYETINMEYEKILKQRYKVEV